jgi:hypothetical protein
MNSHLECGCPTYLFKHDPWCPSTPIYSKMVSRNGGDPAGLWEFIIFGLGPTPNWDKI